MIIRGLRTRGIGDPYRDAEVSVNFDDLGEGVHAITAPPPGNGKGKTHLLELSGPATLYREFVSYGETLASHVPMGVRDAFTELVFTVGGQTYRSLIQIDPQYGGGRGKTDAYLFRRVGKIEEPVASGAKDYQAAIERIVGPKQLFYASVFSAAGGEGSFFEMPKGERKAMFVRMLGLDHLQELSQKAGEQVKVAGVRRQTLQQEEGRLVDQAATWIARKEECDTQKATLEDFERQLEVFHVKQPELVKAVEVAREDLVRAQGEASAVTAHRKRLEDEIFKCEERVRSLEKRITEARDLLKNAPSADVGPDLFAAREELEAARLAEKEISRAKEEATAALSQGKADLAALKAKYGETKARLEGERQVAVQKRESAEAELGRARETLERLQGKSDGLCDVCPMTAETTRQQGVVDSLVVKVEQIQIPPLPLNGALDTLVAEGKERAGKVENLRASAEKVTKVWAGINARVTECVGMVTELEKFEAAWRKAAGARERLQELERQLETAKGDHESALEAMAELPAPPDLGAMEKATQAARGALQLLETEKAQTETRRTLAAAALAKAEAELELLAGARQRLQDLRRELNSLNVDETAWAALEKGLGPDGVQALEISAAGPGITATANELLRIAFGGRFALSIETTAVKKSGVLKEVFDIRIIDSEAGAERKQGSTGEMVLIEEALRLALARYNAEKSDIPLRTLWRDECTTGLSEENCDRYIAMLRHAKELGEFHQVLFVAQQRRVTEQADRQIVCDYGSISVT